MFGSERRRRVVWLLAALTPASCAQILGADFGDGHVKDDAASEAESGAEDGATPGESDGGHQDAAKPADASSAAQIVMFGGFGSGALDDTWTWDGTAWTAHVTTVHPGGRQEAAMATQGHTAVLFGGYDEVGTAGELQDTWVWDGAKWEEKHPAHVPAARSGHQMVTLDDHRVIMFGGENGQPDASFANASWIWDGTDWTRVDGPTPPAVNAAYGGTASLNGDVVVLVNPTDGGALTAWTTWTYAAGSSPQWYNLGAPISLPAGSGTMAATTSQVFSLSDDSSGVILHAWDATNQVWSAVTPSQRPTDRAGFGVAGLGADLVLFGGAIGDDGPLYGETWTFDGVGWRKVAPTAEDPPVRFSPLMASIP